MINLQLTVREALTLATHSSLSGDMYDKIVTAFEVALGVNQNRTVTITGGMNTDNRIPCIKAIRNHTGWGLKEAKDWSDILVGGWKYDKFVPAAANVRNSITLKTPEAAENLLRDLTALGCEGYLS
jgi:ribosomal protein L7/L12